MEKKLLRTLDPTVKGGKEFKAPKHTAQQSKNADKSQEIAIVLPDGLDVSDVSVELLSLDTLPGDMNITWVNFFTVKKNNKPLDGVSYSVFMPDDYFKAGRKFFAHDGQRVRDDIEVERSERAGMVKVTFNFGDPATGWGER